MDEAVRLLLGGDQHALSRLISLIERGDPRSAEVMAGVFPHTGKAYCIGLTGPPGVGKSTLVDNLVGIIRADELSVGILAVDPTSPISGGAFLGDRIRMQRHYRDPGVFIRSMATRDGAGGLPRIVRGVVRLLDAAGKDYVIVETVGVGQTELGIMGVADTVIVTLMPDSGDIIQTLKAGLMEIADIYVVNKADREGSDQMVGAITSALNMAVKPADWIPPVLATEAHKNLGLPELYGEIQRHKAYLQRTSQLEQRRRQRRGEEFLGTLVEELSSRLRELMLKDETLGAMYNGVKNGEMEPYSAALKVLESDLPVLRPLISAPES